MTHEAATCLRQLRDENTSLKQKEQANKEANLQLQAKLDMLQDELRGAEDGQAALGRQNSRLLVNNNPQAKAQYLDKQRAELNALKKENIRFQEDVKAARQREEKAKKRLQEIASQLRPFGTNLCKVLDIPEVALNQAHAALPVSQP